MPKATIEFNLPEESREYKTTMNASEMYCALWNIYNACFKKFDDDSCDKRFVDEIYDMIPTFIYGE